MATDRERLLARRWTHSHEEDAGDEMVFRPADHPFPPARGRMSFELRPDGTYTESAPGPVDAPVAATGSWALENDSLILRLEGDRPGHAWQIVGAEDDRLTVRN